ncbi:MAG: FAD-dependent oxidoreductase, partial [Acidimicrobiales bacterium]
MTVAERIVVVGASLAGLRAAEAVRGAGFEGALVMVGDEALAPYDRPPLSKEVLLGTFARAGTTPATTLARLGDLGAVEWRLGRRAVALDRTNRRVALDDGTDLAYDRLLVATGVRNRPWPHDEQAALDGVVGVRTAGDAAGLAGRLAARPRRV